MYCIILGIIHYELSNVYASTVLIRNENENKMELITLDDDH
jgi:hypothetical protein